MSCLGYDNVIFLFYWYVLSRPWQNQTRHLISHVMDSYVMSRLWQFHLFILLVCPVQAKTKSFRYLISYSSLLRPVQTKAWYVLSRPRKKLLKIIDFIFNFTVQGRSQGGIWGQNPPPLGPYFKHVNEERYLTPRCIF